MKTIHTGPLVCTTEMIAFSEANGYFERLSTCLIGLSVDSNPSHLAWVYDIYCKTGIVILFKIIADRNGMNWYLSFKNPEKCINAQEEKKKIE